MSAYVKDLQRHKCNRCERRATVEVFNTWNAPAGYFCRKHGDEKVRELNAGERR